jgi:hypothetical protein
MNKLENVGDLAMYEVPIFGYKMPLIVAAGYVLAGMYIVGATMFVIERNSRRS